MVRNNLILDLNAELIVDNFAGGGGASTGIELALGRHVDHAFNHDWAALGMHRINHPQTVHHCEDVFAVNPAQVTEGRRVGMGWFSPDCKHFSKAKGGKPLSKKIRGLAFVILRWAKIRVRVIYMENVEEIQTWGPLLANDKPDPQHKGRTWQAFQLALSTGLDRHHPDLAEILEVLGDSVTVEELERGFGYHLETRELRASNYGARTIRKRLFMIARCDGLPIVWPAATHYDPKAKLRPANSALRKLKPWRPVAECIDWALPCPSIFLNKAEAKAARCRRPLAPSTLRRIATGIDRYVLKAKKPFLVSLTHQGGDRVEPIDEPARTLTGAHRGEKALVVPHVERFQGDHHGRTDGAHRNLPMDAPLSTQDTSNRFARVDASVAPFISEHANASNQRTMPADEPMRTLCASTKGGHFSLVAPTLAHTAHGEQDKNGKKRGRGALPVTEPLPSVLASQDCAIIAPILTRQFGCSIGQPVTEPAPTIMPAGQGKTSLVSGTLVQTGYGERDGQQPRALDIEKPLGTIVASGKHAVVSGTIVGAGGPARSGEPRPVDKPFHTLLAKSDSNLAAASMVKLRGTNVGSEATEPLHTVSAAGTHHAVAAAYLAQHNGGFNTTPGHPATEPMSTISAKGSQQQVVTGSIAAYYGSEADGQALDESLRTQSTKARFCLAEGEAVAPQLTEEQIASAHRVAAFLREYGVQFEGDFATLTVEGQQYVIVDIGMRMLTARELFRAQGFPDNYTIDRAWVVDPQTGEIKEIALTKEQQIRMCGNSVSPPVAAAIVAANSGDLAVWNKRERPPLRSLRSNKNLCASVAKNP